MTASPLARYETTLRRLAGRHRLRTLAPRAGLDFASNDYLGLAGSARLNGAVAAALARGVPVGAGGSRLLRGNDPAHEALEAFAASFFRAERALFFGGGFTANVALLTTLPQKGDLIVLDALAHASMHDGARAARADHVITPHNDLNAMDAAITNWRRGTSGVGRVWIIVESLYSMDGDRAPLADLIALADRHEAFLLVDEAHATGVYGDEGRGLTADLEGRENLIVLHTCGKALGASGALVTAPRVLCEMLINRCRPFIYATAPSPLMAVAVHEALLVLRDEPERRTRLAHLVDHAGCELRALAARLAPADAASDIAPGPRASATHATRATRAADDAANDAAARAYPRHLHEHWLAPSGSPIQPIILGDNARAMTIAAALQARGFDVRGVRPPTVPEGTARLRISLTLNVDAAAISSLFAALGDELARAQGAA